MNDKYQMSVEENIFVAKRNIVDYIWKSARLEGIGVTYPETDAIFNGMAVQGISVQDTIAINNLKRAWQFVLAHIDYELDLAYVCRINQLIGGDSLIHRAGWIRNVPVRIGGTTWQPEMPIESKIKEEIQEIHAMESPTDKGITMMLYLMRRQMFFDGNKRTSMLAGNQVMIAHGAGIISVPIEKQPEFMGLLVNYYETNNMEKIKGFVYDQCIDGIAFTRESEQLELPPLKKISKNKEQER